MLNDTQSKPLCIQGHPYRLGEKQKMTPPITKNKKQQTQKTNKNKKLLRLMTGFGGRRGNL